MAAIYWEAQGKSFDVPVGSLGFSVTVFCIEALLAIFILLIRRNPAVGGELGGPKLFKTISSAIFVFFWVFYVMISSQDSKKLFKFARKKVSLCRWTLNCDSKRLQNIKNSHSMHAMAKEFLPQSEPLQLWH